MKNVFMLGFTHYLGGYETQMLRLSSELNKSGVGISIITSNGLYAKKEKILNGINVFFLPSIRSRYTFTLSFIFPILFFFAKNRWKKPLLHAHQPYYGFLGSLVKRFFGGKLIVKVPCSKLYFKPSYLLRLNIFFAVMKNTVDRFIALNNEIKKELLDWGVPEKKISIIPNGVDCIAFKPVKTKKIGQSALFVGRMENQKRPDILIRAWQTVVKEFPAAKLTIFGSDHRKKEFEDLVKELGLEKNIEIIYGKRISAEDYCRHGIYVSTSAFEGMSNSLLEAMACGMPIVATRIPGTTEILQNNKEAILVEPGNANATAKAIIKLLKNKKLAKKLGKKAREKAKKELDIKKIAEKYIELYEKTSDSC